MTKMVCVTATRRYNMTSIATTPKCNNAQVFPRTGAIYEKRTPQQESTGQGKRLVIQENL